MRAVEVTIPNREYPNELVMLDKIIRISKVPGGDTTLLHLTNGETLEVEESVRTLGARLNRKD